MAAFHSLFRADIVSASFDDVIITQAANGRTDAVRAAIAAQWGFDAPAKKDAFISHATKAAMAALKGDKLGVTGYKQRAALCAVLELTVAALKGENLSAEAELTRFTTAFCPIKKAPAATAAPTAATAAPTAATAAPTAATAAPTAATAAPTAATAAPTAAPTATLQQALDMVLAAIASGLLTDVQQAALSDALSVTPALM